MLEEVDWESVNMKEMNEIKVSELMKVTFKTEYKDKLNQR